MADNYTTAELAAEVHRLPLRDVALQYRTWPTRSPALLFLRIGKVGGPWEEGYSVVDAQTMQRQPIDARLMPE